MRVTIKTGMIADDGREEVLTEYLCDWPGCANVAEHMVDVPAELRALCMLCPEHAATRKKRAPGSGTD